MGTLIDSSLWVDYFRAKTPKDIKAQVVRFVDDPQAVLCEPVQFEILRAALESERRHIEQTFATLPLASSPDNLWAQSSLLGQKCLDAGNQPPAMDLLIAQICLAHDLEIVTFDRDFGKIASVCPLKLRLLTRGA